MVGFRYNDGFGVFISQETKGSRCNYGAHHSFHRASTNLFSHHFTPSPSAENAGRGDCAANSAPIELSLRKRG